MADWRNVVSGYMRISVCYRPFLAIKPNSGRIGKLQYAFTYFRYSRKLLTGIIYCCSIIVYMAILFDPKKSEKNILERDLPFELVEQLEWHTAYFKEDTRRNYGEIRLQALVLLEGRLYTVIVTPRGSDLRVISFRKANKREVKLYDKERR